MAVPLKLRPPNPPVVFVGRTAELERLSAFAPVTIVWGPGGLGKSALVAKWLAEETDPRAADALWLRVRAERYPNALLRTLARALGEPVSDVVDRDSLLAAIVDGIDDGNLLVVLDDLHNADVDEAATLLETLGRFLRSGRLIATTRLAPAHDEAAIHVPVGAIPDSELAELAREVRPQTTNVEAQRLAEAARGSPWRLRTLTAGGQPDSQEDPSQLVLTDPFLRALAVLPHPLPAQTLRECGLSVPLEPELDSLVVRGIIERSFVGLRLHDVTNGLLTESDLADLETGPLGDALVAHSDVAAVVAGCRLLIKSGKTSQLPSVFERRADELVTAGYGEELCTELRGLDGDELLAWRIRLGAAVEAAWVLDDIDAPPVESTEVSIAWARLLRGRGDKFAAYEFLTALDSSGVSASDAFKIGMQRSFCLFNLERAFEAVEVERSLIPTSSSQAVALYTSMALDAAFIGEHALARQSAERALGKLKVEPSLATSTNQMFLAFAYLDLGELDKCLAICASGSKLASCRAERIRWVQTEALSLMCFDLSRVAELCEPLDVHSSRPGFDAFSDAIRFELRVLRGELTGLEADIADRLDRVPDTLLLESRRTAIAEADLLTAIGKPLRPIVGDAFSMEALELRLAHARHQALWSELDDASERAIERAADANPTLAAIAAVATFEAAFARGDDELPNLENVYRLALENGYLVAAARILSVRCDELAQNHAPTLRETADELEELAKRIGSRRFLALALWNRAALDESQIDWAAIEKLATMEAVSPVAARRANWLLGEAVDLNRVELRLATRLAERRAECVRGDKSSLDTWGIDLRNHSVWFADETVELGSGLTLRLLRHLAEKGVASKEELILEVWNEGEYHPLRHDPKLRNAIRKLRAQIEPDSDEPHRIITAEDGYGVAANHRIRIAR